MAAKFPVPFWWCSPITAIGMGTLLGGWRIVRTMGHSLTKLQPIGGFCAETGGGVTILALAHAGIPVSTTHTITGAIVGVGATRGNRAVRGALAGRIIWAWIFHHSGGRHRGRPVLRDGRGAAPPRAGGEPQPFACGVFQITGWHRIPTRRCSSPSGGATPRPSGPCSRGTRARWSPSASTT